MSPRKKEEQKKGLDPRVHLEEGRAEIEERHNQLYENRRGGVFVLVDGKRTHESDITAHADREKYGLPPLKNEEAE